jgi:4-aminobutyrate--pyruvate transaminase
LDKLIVAEGPETVAAFFAEPVMGAGGVIVPPATYFAKIQPVLKKHDVLLIADEVICGFGRTGNLWGCDTFGIEPDMITVAKALSSAYLPISALMINERVFQALVIESEKIGTFGHGFTYGGHPVPCAVALRALQIYEDDRIVDHVRAVAPKLQNGLRALAAHPLVGEARGIGLIGALELVRDKSSKDSFPPAALMGAKAAAAAQRHGLITRAMGDTLAFSPPLIIDPGQIGALLGAVERALDDTLALAKKDGFV